MEKWGLVKLKNICMRESKERDILVEGAIMKLARNLALGKFPQIHKDDPN